MKKLSRLVSIYLFSTLCLAVSNTSIADIVLPPGHTWEYAFSDPTADSTWSTTTGGWTLGAAPFGNSTGGFGGVTEFIYNTLWAADGSDGDDLWVRTTIDLTSVDLSTLAWSLGVDNGYKLYINGVLVGSGNAGGYTYRWEYNGSIPQAILIQGVNVIAVALSDYGGLTAFDMQITGDPSPIVPVTVTVQPVQAVVNTQTTSLIAEKDTVLRVFPSIDLPLFPEFNIKARVCIEYNAITDTCYSGWEENTGLIYAEDYEFDEAEYLAGDDSIDIALTGLGGDLLTAGTHTFKTEIYDIDDPSNTYLLFEEVNDYTFVQSKSIGIKTVPIHYKNSTTNTSSMPDDAVLDSSGDLVQVVYPIDEGNVNTSVYKRRPNQMQTVVGDLYIEGHQEGLTLVLEKILKKQKFDLSNNDFYYLAGVLNRVTGGISTLDGIVGFTYPSIEGVVITIDKSNSGNVLVASTMAHEIGHQLGLGDEYCHDEVVTDPITGAQTTIVNFPCTIDPDNPPPQNISDGDVDGKYVQRSIRAYDTGAFYGNGVTPLFHNANGAMYGYMGAGDDTNSWTGNVEYEYLFQKLTSGSVTTPISAQSLGLVNRKVVNVSGIINKDDNVTLEGLLIMDSTVPVLSHQGTEYRLEFGDGVNVFGSVDFDIEFRVERFGESSSGIFDTDSVPFGIAADLPIGTTEIALMKMNGSTPTILASVVRSTYVPVINNISITYPDVNIADVSWSGSDIDGDSLTYSVIYSFDGTQQELIEVETLNTTTNIDLFASPPQSGAYVIVEVSDGFNQNESQVMLNLSTTDNYLLKQYNTRGPNLSSMCRGDSCSKIKTHTLVGKNLSTQNLTVNFTVNIDSTPDPSCTVNSVESGGVVNVAAGVDIAPNGTARVNTNLLFECASNLAVVVDQDFGLTAEVYATSVLDTTDGVNNRITKTQTVR